MTFLSLLDYAGIIVFAITGALVAARKSNDIVGFCTLATVTGIGGGTVRDLLLGRLPVFWIEQPIYIYICVSTAIVTFFTAHFISRYQRIILWADALGIALFTVVGAQIALNYGAPPAVAILMGIITAVFGGIIRDTLNMDESLILKKDIYATACFAGASAYVTLVETSLLVPSYALWVAAALTFALRGAAITYKLSLPGYKWINPQEKD